MYTILSNQSIGIIDLSNLHPNTISNIVPLDNLTVDSEDEMIVNNNTHKIYFSGWDTENSNYYIYVISVDHWGEIASRIPVHGYVSDITVNIVTNMIYAVIEHNTIYAINGSSDKMIEVVDKFNYINNISVDPVTNTTYVVAASSSSPYDSIYAIKSLSNGSSRRIAEIPIGNSVDELSLDFIAKKVYVSTLYPNNIVYVIDGKKNELTDKFYVQGKILALDVNPESNIVYVVIRGPDSVITVDGKTNTNTKIGFSSLNANG